MKFFLPTFLFFVLVFYTNAQTPGVSVFYEQTPGDSRAYIEYIPGNLPIIISAPHGGVKQSGQTIGEVFYPDNDSSLPDRSCGTNERDDNTEILIREIQEEIFALTGCYAHVIINNLHRSKLDPNRDQSEAGCGDADTVDHWNAFHNFIDQASSSVETNWGKGLYIDLHGQSHSIARIELGYNISTNQLNTSDLNNNSIIDNSTIKNLVATNLGALNHEELIRGNQSLGAKLKGGDATFYNANINPGCGVTSGYRAIPSNFDSGASDSCDDTRPFNNAYFDGDFYNNKRHGSGPTANDGLGGGGHIDGIMSEVNRRVRDLGTYNGNVYDTRPQTLVPFAKDYAAVLLDYINTHYNDYANFSYSFSVYNINDANVTPNLTGRSGGVFSSTIGLSINATTGTIDISNSSLGNYVVTYSTGICGYFKQTFNIHIIDSTPDSEAPTVPVNLAASNTTQTITNLTWVAATDNIGVVAYDIYRDSNIIATVVGTTYQATGLTASTAYTFSVFAKDAAGNQSIESNTVNVTTTDIAVTYCNSASTNVNDEFISRVQLNTIDKSSGAQFYSDFTSISTPLTKDSQYTITVTPTWTETVYNEAYSVWIDYNRDGDFTDAGEQVFTQGNTKSTSVSGSFTIPSSAVENSTRMRVSMKYNGIPTPCETFQYGEVEDYTIVIESSGPDIVPPVITLIGASLMDLNVGSIYTEQGATAVDDLDGDITANIIIGGATVDTNTGGTYLVTYDVTDAAGNLATQVVRTVNIIPDITAPVITLVGASTLNLNVGGIYTEQGATAVDDLDGDITANIVIGGVTVDTNTGGTYLVTYDVTDAAGNVATQVIRTVNVLPDTTVPVITLIGASVINLNVADVYTEFGATASDNFNGNITASIVIGGDTVNTNLAKTYNVTYNVSDAAGNVATQVSRAIIVTDINTGCSGGIASFPYSEGFENTLGEWTQSSSDDINWTVDANGTPSSNTGPSSATQGSFYVYVEASSPNSPSKRAILNSPCFDLSSLTDAIFSFNYHMYGAADMGSIDLEISQDEGLTWASIWNETGNKGNSWQTAIIDLSAYIGGGIQLRFNRFVGGTWQADIAIDNISLIEGEIVINSCSGGITSYPYAEGLENTIGLWTQSSADNINWTVDANGTPSSNTGPSSAVQGSYYIFVEASGNGTGYPNKQAIINSPCYDLSGVSFATFSFNYHMYGANDTGTIALEASNDNGISWTPIWSESGNKGNTWLSTSINLSTYTGNSVQLRFNRITGNTWQADIALDNISLTTVVALAKNDSKEVLLNVSKNNFNKLTLYPNPVGNILSVKTSKGGEMTFRIINSLGQIVNTGKTSKEVIVDNLEAGMYFIEVNDGANKMMERFLKE